MPASVHFLLGRANSGKTYHITQCLRQAMAAGRRAVLLVPEQYTYEAERALSQRLGGLLGIQVLSFERLAVRATGAQDRPFLSAQGRRMVMRRVAYQNKTKLQAFSSVAHRTGFAARMDGLYVLCKRYEITPDMLLEAAGALRGEPGLSAKLSDMALLFAGMQAYLDEHFIDSEDALHAFLQSIPYSFLKGAEVYIDGLDGIGARLYTILQALLLHCGEVHMSFCVDPDPAAQDAALFAPEREAYERLRELAAALGCPVYEQCLPARQAGRADALVHLERSLFAAHALPYEGEPPTLQLVGATDRTAEVEAMAEELLALVRGGMRFRDIAVVASDMQAYSVAVQRAFARRDIPVFFDSRKGMQGHPAVELLLAAARVAANGLTRAELVRIAKTGLAGVTQQEAEAFENHCLRRGIIGGRRLQEPFAEAAQEETWPGDTLTEQALAERARARLVPPLVLLREAFAGTAAEMTAALYHYLELLGVQAQLADTVEQLGSAGRFALMEEHAQVWDILMELFSQLHAILGGTPLRKREYLEVFNEALSAYQVGVIPATADQVLFGDIARTRSREVQALFVLGCNEGLFPRPRQDDELLDDAELAAMAALGIAPWEDTTARAQGDRLDIYRALARASARLYLSFSYSDGSRELVPATLLDRVRALFPHMREQAASDRSNARALPQSEQGGFALLLRHLEESKPPFPTLRGYYGGRARYAARLRQAQAFAGEPAVPAALGTAQATRLYGGTLHTSVSRLETFRSCPFRHFALSGMGARPRQEFKEKQADIGSFSHMALDAFVRAVRAQGMSYTTITEEEIDALLDTLLPRCLEEYQEGLLIATPRTRMLSEFWCDAVRTTARAMCAMLREGSFVPVETEVVFGGQGALPAIAAGPALIHGKIDRLDSAPLPDGNALLRVVDYKTGSAELRYAELADGLSLQLAIYLAAAAQRRGATPVGLFYQPVRDPAEEEDDAGTVRKKLRLNGMLQNGDAAKYATATEAKLTDIAKATLLEPQELDALLAYSVRRAGEIAGELLAGKVSATPVYRGRGTTCTYCEYRGVCRFDVRLRGCRVRRVRPCSKEEFFAKAGVREE